MLWQLINYILIPPKTNFAVCLFGWWFELSNKKLNSLCVMTQHLHVNHGLMVCGACVPFTKVARSQNFRTAACSSCQALNCRNHDCHRLHACCRMIMHLAGQPIRNSDDETSINEWLCSFNNDRALASRWSWMEVFTRKPSCQCSHQHIVKNTAWNRT